MHSEIENQIESQSKCSYSILKTRTDCFRSIKFMFKFQPVKRFIKHILKQTYFGIFGCAIHFSLWMSQLYHTD